MKIIKNLLAFASLSLLAACGDSVTTPEDDHEHESITTVELKLSNRALAGDTLTLKFVDADGTGGAAPTLPSVGRLRSGATYDASVRFLDQSNPSDVHDLNEEIGGSESDDHRIFWTTGARLTATISDKDSKGLMLGLRASLATISTGTDTLHINLRHLPGIKTANSTITDGETDAEIAFPLDIAVP